MNIEGNIHIQLYPHKTESKRVRIHSTRPVHAAKILINKTPEQALSIVPLIFHVCRIAQSRAALSTLQQNLNITPQTTEEYARDLLVLSETAKEHLLKIQLNWPTLFQQKQTTTPLNYLGTLLNDFTHSLFKAGNAFSLNSQFQLDNTALSHHIATLERYLEQHIFTQKPDEWRHMHSIEQLRDWAKQSQHIAAYSIQHICEHRWASQGHSTCSPLPALNQQQLITKIDTPHAEQFIAQPTWQGQHHETNSLSRQAQHPLIRQLQHEFDNGLITRWTARLVELAQIPQAMRKLQHMMQQHQTTTKATTTQHGLSQVEAARGRLIHRSQIRQNTQQPRIKQYQIVAPTEWNFHPQGLIQQSLCHIKARNQQEHKHLANLIINAIDPCVAYQLSIH